MRARNVLCTLGIGALAMSVSAYAAPREAQSGKSPRPESSRLIAGHGGELRSGLEGGTVATGGGVLCRLKPVAVNFNVNAPGGNWVTTGVAGDTATLPGGPALIKLEGSYAGWGVSGQKLKTYQLTIDPAGLSSSDAGGSPLLRPTVACADPAGGNSPQCTASMAASGSPGDLRCSDPFALECNNLWQETGRGDYIAGFGLPACAQAGLTCGDTTFTAGTDDNAGERYGFSAVFEADAGAQGCYTLQLDPLDPALGANFLQLGDGTLLPIQKTIPAKVCIPLGRCCTVPGTPACNPQVTEAACDAVGGLFDTTQDCPPPIGNGGQCAECTSDGACNDGDACTTERCENFSCVRGLKAGFTGAAGQCCDGATGAITNVADDGDPCTLDQCVGSCPAGTLPPGAYPASTCGSAGHVAASDGTTCSDGNPCTSCDVCTTGLCAGVDINNPPRACVLDADCNPCGDSSGVCEANVCVCRLNPNLSIELSHEGDIGDKVNACYEDNEKVTATIQIGSGAFPIVGVQFAITYDEACLGFQSIQPAGPWTSILMVRLGGQCAGGVRDGQACGTQGCAQGGGTCVPAGTVFYAAGIPLGGDIGICDGGSNDKGFCNFSPGSCPGGTCLPIQPGTPITGNSDAATLVFSKKPGCVGKPGQPECEICFSDNNPLHTYLSDNTGQVIQVDAKCSEGIKSKSPIDLVTPIGPIKVNKGCDSNVATVTWPNPTVDFGCNGGSMVCNGINLETDHVWDQAHVLKGGVFAGGNNNFCCTATNNCNNVLEKCWTVTVNDETSLEVEIQLSPTMKTKAGGGVTRCIKFQVFNNCVQAPDEFSKDLEFGGLLDLVGHFTGHVKIPFATQPACITARDQKHTLRSCYTFGEGDCDSNGVLHATFKQDPFFGGNWLVGGNLDGWKKDNPNASHDIIDILDFGSLVSQWLSSFDTNGDGDPDGNTPCDLFPGTHADINGDGLVDLNDFSFIAMNFLDNSKDCCCPGSASLGNTVGRTEISVRELREQGMSDLAVSDLNADGKVDMADMAALMQGVRPNLKANDGGKNGSRSNNRK